MTSPRPASRTCLHRSALLRRRWRLLRRRRRSTSSPTRRRLPRKPGSPAAQRHRPVRRRREGAHLPQRQRRKRRERGRRRSRCVCPFPCAYLLTQQADAHHTRNYTQPRSSLRRTPSRAPQATFCLKDKPGPSIILQSDAGKPDASAKQVLDLIRSLPNATFCW